MHIEAESGEHDPHCFQAVRRMDKILLANFMVFQDLVREEDITTTPSPIRATSVKRA